MVSINLVVYNGTSYIRHCLDALKQLDYENIEINILDNASKDTTAEIISSEYPKFNLIKSSRNVGMWPGQEILFKHSSGEYILALSVDVILDRHSVSEAVKIFQENDTIGGVQPKIYAYDLKEINNGKTLKNEQIDTCGFNLSRSRRIGNIGHGEKDKGQFNKSIEIFGVEGAAPFFRRNALENIRVEGNFADPDFFWYVDDFDLAWRMHLFDWKQMYAPLSIAYHDRATTKKFKKGYIDFIKGRRKLPFKKRALEYRNTIFTIIKNDHIKNLIKDAGHIILRHIPLWGYFLIFETAMIKEIVPILKLLPNMIKRRREVMNKASISADHIHKWLL